jgi:diguanylate cyclase (GGDEF)-like protein
MALAVTTILNVVSPAAYPAREIGLAVFIALLVALPLLIAGGLMASRIEALRKETQRLGQRDVLTACLNESTFSALVDTYANDNTIEAGAVRGTVLLISVDDLGIVNDRFGYSWGNEALARVAAIISETVRHGDIVGRVSRSQFGVFLPQTDEANAKTVADRIYHNVTTIDFFPTGVQYPLSIRAGAVIVSDSASFDELLRKATGTLAMTEGTDEEWIRYTSLNETAPRNAANLQ